VPEFVLTLVLVSRSLSSNQKTSVKSETKPSASLLRILSSPNSSPRSQAPLHRLDIERFLSRKRQNLQRTRTLSPCVNTSSSESSSPSALPHCFVLVVCGGEGLGGEDGLDFGPDGRNLAGIRVEPPMSLMAWTSSRAKPESARAAWTVGMIYIA
jgi:hypothetical protein